MANLIHRGLAVAILLFVVAHIFNHLVGLAGVEAHSEFMDSARAVYRNPVVEPVLLIAVFCQVLLGLYFVYRSWGDRAGFFQKAQVASGCYLALFLLARVGATLSARNVFDLDTNFFFAAAGMHTGAWAYFFVPYYFLVVSIFVHVAAAVHWALTRESDSVAANRTGYVIMGMGAVVAITIVATLGGLFYEVVIPPEYGVMFNQ
ncbi:hypothetical protein ACXYTJ_06865 [Gilvimarinus sp. F26214L]|uniref:hypothetical protein n=1 Tax=Gilvimarinus sp. DZF01 TaxID=3461371 RepID=UPI0040454726